MTAKRGMLWKTPWRRQSPVLGTAPQDMYFFVGFAADLANAAGFQQPLSAPSIGDVTQPFWVGGIFGSWAPPSVGQNTSAARGVQLPAFMAVVPAWELLLSWSGNVLFAQVHVRRTILTPLLAATTLSTLGAGTSPFLVRAVIMMLVVTSDGPNLRATLWVDGAIRATAVSAVPAGYDPSVGQLFLFPNNAALNSMAGGNAEPTKQEILTWFSASRYASPYPAAQDIPGKTSDRFDAGFTPGVVPNPIVNLAGGQNAPLVSVGTPPAPQNLLLPTTFAY